MNPKIFAVILFIGAGLFSGAASASQAEPTQAQVYAHDDAVSHKVVEALQSSKNIRTADIRVSTRNGTVLLSGYVRSDDELLEAVLVAQSVRGVYDVKSDLLLKGQLKS